MSTDCWLLVGDAGSIHLRRLAVGLSARGIEVHVASQRSAQVAGVTLHSLPGAGYPLDLGYAAAVLPLRSLARRLRPAVVNAHYLSSYGLATALTGIREVVQTVWGTDLLVTAQRFGWRVASAVALRRAALVTGCSQSLLHQSRRLAPHTPVHEFVFGPPEWLFDEPRDSAVGGVILSPRQHEPLYRIDLILRAWESARVRLPDHELVVAGTGSLTAQLRAAAGPRVRFIGQVPHDELMRWMLRSDVVVSLPTSDASGQSVLEAMAARASVVASDVAAMREWLPARHLVPLDAAPETIARALERAISRPLSLDKGWSLDRQVPILVEAVKRVRNIRAA